MTDPERKPDMKQIKIGASEEDDVLVCCEEWCDDSEGRDTDAGVHGEMCPERLVTITKADIVRLTINVVEATVRDYLVTLDSFDAPDKHAIAVAEDQAQESGMCFTGIGSCGRGWCHHS